jgi:heme-degrading monooxygenase HmoA
LIVCIRTVDVPAAERERFLQWIETNRTVREEHGILFELVLEADNGTGEHTVITAWPSHEVFDAWIATPERDRLTASDVHSSVNYRPITRHQVVGGYINHEGPAKEYAV